MKHVWQLEEAKDRFSEVVEEAINHGPQVITRIGAETVVIISCAEYHRLLAAQKKLSNFFGESPLAGVDLDLTRDTGEIQSIREKQNARDLEIINREADRLNDEAKEVLSYQGIR
jgi:antitoxin Phd